MWVHSVDQEDPLEEEMATHSGILAWKITWTEEPGGLQSMGLPRVRHECATKCICMHTQTQTHTHACSRTLTHTHTHPVVWTVEDCVQVGGKAGSGLDSSPIIGKCCGLVSSRNSEAQLLHLHYGIKKNHLNQFGTQGFLHQQRVR